MPCGYNGKILRVNLSQGEISVQQPGENFYRRYLGGRGFVSYYLLTELEPGVEPLSPENKLIFAAGVVTGAPVGGCGRNSVGAKSPLTGAYGDAEVGGYFGAELKRAGYDAIVFEGKSPRPVYLWIEGEKAELRDAGHLWGKPTAEAQELIWQELGDREIRTAQIGPAGEKLVRYACVTNDITHAAGRTGMGAVMGSKNLKAVAVRGRKAVELANPEAVKALAKWLSDTVVSDNKAMYDHGTPYLVVPLNKRGGLPTRNFQQGAFEGADNLSGRLLTDTMLVARRSCWACPVHCKREVQLEGPYSVSPTYGGPEYETIASVGSNCGVDDLKAVAKANEICNANGLDTISAGVAISFAMECYERGILSQRDIGFDLSFGNAGAMVKMVEMIARREGLGHLLGEGVARAARSIGKGAEEYAMHIKGQEVPMHEPRFKQGMGLGYAISPTGADHCHDIHDTAFEAPGASLDSIKTLGVLDPLPITDLSPAKVRLLSYYVHWTNALNCLVTCMFVHFNYTQVTDLVKSVTGWNTSLWELMKVGERCVHMNRAFNVREGFSSKDDYLPSRFFTPFVSGPLHGVKIDEGEFEKAKETYYRMMGWQGDKGMPTGEKLEEMDIGWVASKL